MPKDEPIIGSADTALRKMLEDARHKPPSPWNRSTETPPPKDGTDIVGKWERMDTPRVTWWVNGADFDKPIPDGWYTAALRFPHEYGRPDAPDFWMPIPPLPEKG